MDIREEDVASSIRVNEVNMKQDENKMNNALDEIGSDAQDQGFYDIAPHSQRIRDAIEIAENYGQIDGAHHKMWVIDKMIKTLCGSQIEYDRFIEEYEEGDDGPETYDWDTGIAP